MKIGLRVDVDTYRGTKYGVPALCRIFKEHGIKASFFFSVGPDNMGRHLWRLLKPAFLRKMMRSNAPGLYGPEIILMGTMWPGLSIGKHLNHIIKACDDDGHEIGFHAWDHHREQMKIERFSEDEIRSVIRRGVESLREITGSAPVASAVPGWRCNDKVLLVKEEFNFKYNSDCRGRDIFKPIVDGTVLNTVQIPVTLPTYDEVIGENGITDDNYNDYLLSLLKRDRLNILTVHAEAEGGKCAEMFDEFIKKAALKGAEFVPLGNIADTADEIGAEHIEQGELPGREGWVACQCGYNQDSAASAAD